MLRRISKQKFKSRTLATTSGLQKKNFGVATTLRSQLLTDDLSQGLTYAQNRQNLIENKNSIRRVIGKKQIHVGTLTLKNQSKFNFLTQGMLVEIMKNIEWMDWDGYMKFVVVESDDTEIFSFGTDLKTIKHYIEDGDLQSISNYISNLQNATISVSRWNKPHLLQLSGTLKNSAIGVFSQACFVSADKSTQFDFNEVEQGSTLLGGNSYLLSRLPSGVGEFVALTGYTMDYYDIQNFNLVNKRVHIGQEELEQLDQTYTRGSTQYPDISYLNHTGFMKEKIQRHFGEDQMHKELIQELTDRITNGENPSSVLKDLIYKTEISYISNNYEKANQYDSFRTKLQDLIEDEEVCIIENRQKSFEVIHLNHIENKQRHIFGSVTAPRTSFSSDGQRIEQGFLTKNIDKLKFIFDRSTFSEVLTTLRQLSETGDYFAQEILTTIESYQSKHESSNLVEILFNQIRQARELDLVSCLNNEYSTALEFFGAESAEQLQLASPERALLPVRDYYSYLPDAVRYSLNGNPCNDAGINKNYIEVNDRYTQMQGIDPFNPVNTPDQIRKEFWDRKYKKEVATRRNSDLNSILYNFRKRREFLSERTDSLAKFFNQDSTELKQSINQIVANTFNEKLLKNQELAIESSHQLNKLQRKKELSNLRQTIAQYNMKEIPTETPTFRNTLTVVEVQESINDAPINKETSLEFQDIADMYDSQSKFTQEHIDQYFNGKLNKFDLVSIKKNDKFSDQYSRVFNKTDTYERNNLIEIFRDYYMMNRRINNKTDTKEDEYKNKWINKNLKYMKEKLGNITPEVQERLAKELDYLYFDQIDEETKKLIDTRSIKRTVDLRTPDIESEHLSNTEIDTSDMLSQNEIQTALDHFKGLIDLDLESNERLGQYARDNNYSIESNEAIEKFLKEQIEYDELLSQNLSILFLDNNDSYLNSICKRFRTKLVDITRAKITEIFKNTENGSSILPIIENALGDEANFEFMGQIDAYLNKNIKYEFFRYIQSHVLYRFAYFELKNFEKLFNLLKGNENSDLLSNDQIRNTINAELGIGIRDDLELELFTKFVDEFCVTLGILLNEFEGQVHFSDDLLLLKADDAEEDVIFDIFRNRNKQNKFIKYFKQLALEEEKAQLEETSLFNPEAKQQKNKLESIQLALSNVDPQNVPEQQIKYYLYELRRATASFKTRPVWKHTMAENIIQLDRYYKRIVEGEKSGIISSDVENNFEEVINNLVDISSSGEEWVTQSIQEYIRDLLMVRQEAEKVLNNEELIAYDAVLEEYLSPENIEKIAYEKMNDLKFKLNLVKELETRQQILDETNQLNNNKMQSMSYLIRNRFRNSIAFKQLKALFFMIDYKNSDEFEGTYTEDDQLLDKIALKRLIRECQLPEGEHLQEYKHLMKAQEGEKIIVAEEKVNYDPYCHLIIRGFQEVDAATEETLKQKVDEYVSRLNLYGM